MTARKPFSIASPSSTSCQGCMRPPPLDLLPWLPRSIAPGHGGSGVGPGEEKAMSDTTHWVGTWTATPAPGEGAAFANHTLRMMPRVSLGGSVLRVRISNAYGARPLTIGAARVGVRSGGPAVVAGSNRRVTFGGEPSATIAARALILSDPVQLALAPLSDLAVSVHLPGDLPASFGITGRYARQTNYVSAPGHF